ncbi:MAG TPA: response regulator transcription factor, partial [Phycisphaerae bacterium]|nr:response regulator transcription factor [Phycisphaerae bacterium]
VSSAGGWTGQEYKSVTSVGLVGGSMILRAALFELLKKDGLEVVGAYRDAQELAESFAMAEGPVCSVLVLLISGGPFTSYHSVRDALARTERSMPLVVLSDQTSRGQVYAALRIGAKAYVNFDADPIELSKAIRSAAQHKAYLAPAAAELLVQDVSQAIESSGNSRLPGVDLSRRENEVLQLLCEACSSKEVARQLHISAKTVENHRYNIYRKCQVDSIASLMRHAIQNGLVSI